MQISEKGRTVARARSLPVFSFFDRLGWSNLRIGGSLMAAVGAWGVATGLPEFRKMFSPRTAPSFVFVNDQRLPPVEALEQLRSSLSGNAVTVLILAVSLILASLVLFSLIQLAYERAPLRALMSGVFLGGAVLSGFVFGIIALKVNELAIQSKAATAAEQAWLEGGITYLNQAHLVFVYGWFLFMGLAWLFLGLGAPRSPRWARLTGATVVIAGAAVTIGVGARFWLPSYGETAPEFMLFLASGLLEFGMALGLLSSGLLVWSVPHNLVVPPPQMPATPKAT